MHYSDFDSPVFITGHGSLTAPLPQHSLPSPPSSSPESENSDRDSEASEESVASSQTSYSSQEQWPIQPQADPQEPVGKLPLADQYRYLPPPPQLQHPRRTSARVAPVPALAKTIERKGQFVYHLVDSATHLVEIVWPTSAPACAVNTHRGNMGAPQCHQSMLPLRTFIEETLRRSKTSFSTLQVALYYLILLKQYVPSFDFTMEQPDDCPLSRAVQCGRRMFLAALILGSKYLQDRNYSARAWSKISGLQVSEINLNERAFLAAVNWQLHLPEPVFNRWQDILVKYSQPNMVENWRQAVRTLTAEMISAGPVTPWQAPTPVFKPVDWRSRTQSPVSPTDVQKWTSSGPSPPYSVPHLTEPRFVMQPPAAPIALKLTTPSPMSSACSTPAASSASDMLRYTGRPRAMCSAMSMATSRYCVDLAPSTMGLTGAPGQFSRRSSLATTNSSYSVAASPASSPGSMISDHSSCSSSIGSISYQQTSPVRNHALARLAAANASNRLNDLSAAAAALSSTWDDSLTVIGSGPLTAGPLTSSPETIIIEDDTTPIAYENHMRETRKRNRCSVDSNAPQDHLQDYVRNLMRQDLQPSESYRACPPFVKRSKPAAKKACYTREVNMGEMRDVQGQDWLARPEGGPGMWSGILN